MAESTVIKNFRDGSLTIEDATSPTPLNYVVAYEAGDFSFDIGKDEIAVYRDRGAVASVRRTNQGLPTGSFTIHFRDLSDAADETLTDILDKKGAFAAAVSTLGANADVYTVKLTFTIAGTVHGDNGGDHTISFDDCYCTWSFAEGDPSSCTVNWTCHGTVTQT
jgi:hypothetical protein